MTNPRNVLKDLPHSPGIYIYRDTTGTVLYVGKAIDLKRRVSQYFLDRDAIGAKTTRLVPQIADIEIKTTPTEFDALLLEAAFIQKYFPKYNTIAKDDKSRLYIALTTKEDLPHIQFVRKTSLSLSTIAKATIFGPFESGPTARSLMRSLRHIVPYCTQKERTGKRCFYTHLGLCGPCPSEIAKLPEPFKNEKTHEYRHHIFQIRDILSGKSTNVLHDMEREMETLAKNERFEEATLIRNHIQSLHALMARHYDPMRYETSEQQLGDRRKEELEDLQTILRTYYPDIHELSRIECIDISNTGGKESTGSLVVLANGIPDTGQYRRFRIITKLAPNDFAMIREVVLRRLKHPEWPFPELLVIDGGKGQVGAATQALQENGIDIPVIGLAKRYEEIVVPVLGNSFKVIRTSLTRPGIHVLQRIRDEAHRFALSYHRLLRSKARLPKRVV